MLSRILAAAAAGLTLGASGPVLAAGDDADLYTGFTLIDPEVVANVTDAWLVVRNGKIERIGSGKLPKGDYDRHDMRGLYAMPGLIDAHAHVAQGPYAVSIVDGAPRVEMVVADKFTRFNAMMALAFGVTTVRNPGGPTEAASHYDTMLARGDWIGPEALHAGSIMEPKPFAGEAFGYPANAREWNAEAARQAHAGMTYFKLYQDLTEDELAQGVAAAKANGLIPIAHLNAVSWTRAAQLGIEQFEHAMPTSAALLPQKDRAGFVADPAARFHYRWFELVDLGGPEIADLLRTMRERQSVATLTLMATEVTYNVEDLSEIFPDDELKYYQPELLASARGSLTALATLWNAEDAARAQAAWPKVLTFTKLLHDSGIRLMIGTDGGGGSPFYARELSHHVAAGIPARDVLRMATSGNAALMGLTDTGRIAPGLEADVVFLRADPAKDVRNVRQVEATLSNGKLYRFDALVAQAQGLVEGARP
jgi:imidazolonepropionase-like amidohydrolase